jgi:hypothetical protein
MQTQGWALDVQMSSIGRKPLASSRLVNRVVEAPLEARTE